MADKLKLTKVEEVQALSGGSVSVITLQLTAHHLILSQVVPDSQNTAASTPPRAPKTRESWVAYPMIAFCTYRPTPPGSGRSSSIRLRCRDFRFLSFNFSEDWKARDVFESIKGATCRLGSIENLYAFAYRPPPHEREFNGWDIYDAKAEWKRQGISEKGADRGWRISKLNADYAFSPTYPALLAVPSSISDNTLNYAGRYRSKVRIPVLTYLHPVNNCSLTRSAQPLTGLRGNHSIQDEKLVSACFSGAAQIDGKEATSTPISRGSPAISQTDLADSSKPAEISEGQQLEDELIASSSIEIDPNKPLVYGAQQHNLIVDARPTVNAMANAALGRGTENMDHYKFATKAYLGIENIHVMRESLAKVVEAIKDADISPLPPNRDMLAKSGWLKHIAALLDGASLIARQVGIHHSHVLLHCSDGWDRTSQLIALAQLLLDPYYRTIDGFIVLIEKDWLAFGHMFQERAGSLNSEKWFITQTDALAGSPIPPGSNAEGRGDAFDNVLSSAKRFFNKNPSQEVVTNSDGEVLAFEDSPKTKRISAFKDRSSEHDATKLKDVSPIFHQFLDTTYQLLCQFPDRFEFNERFLRRLLYHVYSCQYGTFLYNNEKSRLDARAQERTPSVWGYFLSRRAEFANKNYDGGEINDNIIGRERLILPKLEKVRWWHELFNRTDEEMNGRSNAATERYLGKELSNGSGVLTGVETAASPAVGAAASSTRKISTGGSFSGLRDQFAALGITKGGNNGVTTVGNRSPGSGVKQELEVEMQ